MTKNPIKVLFVGNQDHLPEKWTELMQGSPFEISYEQEAHSRIDELGQRKILRNDVLFVDFRNDASFAKKWTQDLLEKAPEEREFSVIAVVNNTHYDAQEFTELCDDIIDERSDFTFLKNKVEKSFRFHKTLSSFKNDFYYPVENAVLTYNHEINNKLTIGMWAAEEGLINNPDDETLQATMKSFQNVLEIVKKIESVKREKLNDHKMVVDEVAKKAG